MSQSYLSDCLPLIHHHGFGALVWQMDANHQLRREETVIQIVEVKLWHISPEILDSVGDIIVWLPWFVHVLCTHVFVHAYTHRYCVIVPQCIVYDALIPKWLYTSSQHIVVCRSLPTPVRLTFLTCGVEQRSEHFSFDLLHTISCNLLDMCVKCFFCHTCELLSNGQKICFFCEVTATFAQSVHPRVDISSKFGDIAFTRMEQTTRKHQASCKGHHWCGGIKMLCLCFLHHLNIQHLKM